MFGLSCFWGHRLSMSCFIESSNSWGRKKLSVELQVAVADNECSDFVVRKNGREEEAHAE